MLDKEKTLNNLIEETRNTLNTFNHQHKYYWEEDSVQQLMKVIPIDREAFVTMKFFALNFVRSQQATMRSLIRMSEALQVLLQETANSTSQEANNEGSKD